MSIHQVSLAYQADQDRLLLRMRTRDGQLFELWFTRRMMLRLWQPLQKTAAELALGRMASQSTVLPEARDMMAQTLRERSQQAADFQSPFDETASARPLGETPMLVSAVDLRRRTDGQADIVLRDQAKRRINLHLEPQLLNNLLTLMDNALRQSEWGLPAWGPKQGTASTEGADAAAGPAQGQQRLLN